MKADVTVKLTPEIHQQFKTLKMYVEGIEMTTVNQKMQVLINTYKKVYNID